MSELLSITIYSEKIAGKGEDAEPLLEAENNTGFIGAFDGLGGAGSTIYEENGVVHSGAYYAARMAQNITLNFFKNLPQTTQKTSVLVESLRNKLTSELQQKATELDKTPSKLKSSLIKRLPTTVAIMFFVQNKNDSNYRCLSMWAGDSRGYFLTPEEGLRQTTKDDLKSGDDALDNLRNDSPLSNYVNADTDFILNYKVEALNLPCVLLTATDGCFSYVSTPMHFEFILLDTLVNAQNLNDWQSQLKEKLVSIASDDVSMALVAVGWSNFSSFQKSFRERYFFVLGTYIDKFNQADEQMKHCQEKVTQCAAMREEMRLTLWSEYKKSYEGLVRKEDDDEKRVTLLMDILFCETLQLREEGCVNGLLLEKIPLIILSSSFYFRPIQ